jgi:hypothetical protein
MLIFSPRTGVSPFRSLSQKKEGKYVFSRKYLERDKFPLLLLLLLSCLELNKES